MSARSFNLFGTAKRFGNVTIDRVALDGAPHGVHIVSVKLHRNEVVVIDTIKGLVKVSNCGWVTPTTHKAINNALSQAGAPFSVYAKKGMTLLHDSRDNSSKPLVNNEWLRFREPYGANVTWAA